MRQNFVRFVLLCAFLSVLSARSMVEAQDLAKKRLLPTSVSTPLVINLTDLGAGVDGEADDGPAFQSALDALASAGGGTLFVPQGRYAIVTPLSKNFSGLASSIAIEGVASLTPVAPPTSPASELASGLDLVSEIYPRSGASANAITITGLQSLLIKDIAFIGTQTVTTDAAVSLLVSDIENASIKHCEFYGLATFISGGGVIKAVRSNLNISECKFLGSTADSGQYVPVVENVEWRGITILDTHFVDYGLRPAFYAKTNLGAAISWINIGNAAAVTPKSPRRAVVIRDVFLDEGSYLGSTSLPFRYQPASAPIDLIYISDLKMNVSNFFQTGHYLSDAERVFIQRSHYGWSHNASSAMSFLNIGNVLLDQLTCIDHADVIFADANTERLTLINSSYSTLASSAPITTVIGDGE